MWRLIKFLFTGSWHEHDFKCVAKTSVINPWQKEGDIPHSIYRTYVCKCGASKRIQT